MPLPGLAGISMLRLVTHWPLRLSRVLTVTLLPMLIAGCAGKEINWEARRGQYTYAEAVKQYGEPAQVETLPTGGKTGYWSLSDAQSYAFKFQLTNFDGNSEGSLNPGKGDLPPGGRALGTVGKPVLKLTFGADDRLTDAARLKDAPIAPAPPIPVAPATSAP